MDLFALWYRKKKPYREKPYIFLAIRGQKPLFIRPQRKVVFKSRTSQRNPYTLFADHGQKSYLFVSLNYGILQLVVRVSHYHHSTIISLPKIGNKCYVRLQAVVLLSANFRSGTS